MISGRENVPRMAEISARYQQTVIRFPHPGGPDPVSILPRDPQRYYLRIVNPPNPAFTIYAFTGNPGFTGGFGLTSNLPLESKWHDDPAGTTEEWFAITAGATEIIIFVTRFLGE